MSLETLSVRDVQQGLATNGDYEEFLSISRKRASVL